MKSVAFDDLRWLNLLWGALAVAAIGAYGIWQRRCALRRFAEAPLLARLAPRWGWTRPLVRLALVAACLVVLTAGAVGPRWGDVERTVVRRGIDVMVVLDLSRSMLARDIAPNRLERAKLSIRDDLLPVLGGDRIGLIGFAGVAKLKCPLTSDYGFFRLALDELSPDAVPRGGTAIGDALRLAGKSFHSPIDTHKVVLLLTDGEDQESYPVEAAKALWEDQKVPVIAIALGDDREGARIPVRGGDNYVEYKGETVWSKANFPILRAVAAASDFNAFIPAGTRNFDLGKIFRERVVPAIEFSERREQQRIRQPSRMHVFAVAALCLLALDSLLRDGPRPMRENAEFRMKNAEREVRQRGRVLAQAGAGSQS
ncbi:MAG: VWA domain-containing protein [Phycisphaerae bacterium]